MLPPGTKVAEYRIVSSIVSRRSIEVCKAQSERHGTIVALKLVPLTFDDDVVAAERLGASLQQRFEQAHGLVPKVFECGPDQHYFYIAMELVDAPTLDALIKCGPLKPTIAASYAISICKFLEKVHAFATEISGQPYTRMIHGDLKPEHVCVFGHGAIKVLDFGISKALQTHRTATKLAGFTPAYSPPRRMDTTLANEKDDLWALAVMLYEMIAGHRPYSKLERPDSYLELQHAIEVGAPREPLPTSCPAELAAIIDKGLHAQEELRFASAAAFRADLERYLRGESPEALKQFATPPTVRAEPRDPPVVAFAPTFAVPTIPRSAAAARWSALGRRGAWVMALVVVTIFVMSEAVALVGAERIRGELPALDLRTIATTRQQYARQRRWSMFHVGQRWRLDQPLKRRLIVLADGVLAAYRQEGLPVTKAQWLQAREALDWASELAPDTASISPKQLVCSGHIDRITAQSHPRTSSDAQRLYTRAIDQFKRAARLATQSADPYLGLSAAYAYGLNDFDRGHAAMHEAEVRGHIPGWRERAQIADGYRQRADEARRNEARVADESRDALRQSARDDYARCVEVLTPVLDKGNWKYNRDYCERHRDALDQTLQFEVVER